MLVIAESPKLHGIEHVYFIRFFAGNVEHSGKRYSVNQHSPAEVRHIKFTDVMPAELKMIYAKIIQFSNLILKDMQRAEAYVTKL